MKHLLTGVAMAAALAIAAPVWAQTAPMTPPAAPPAAAPKAPATPAKPAMAKPMAKKPMHHMAMHHHHRGMMGEGDKMTEDLNKQELDRITGGGGAAPMPMSAPGGNNPTSGSAGPFAPAPGMGAPPPAK
jgi:hypothetical protein